MGRLIPILVLVFVLIVGFGSYQAFVAIPQQKQTLESMPDSSKTSSNLVILVDRITEAALDKNWYLCNHYLDQLQSNWDFLKPESSSRLNLISEVDTIIAKSHILILQKDQSSLILKMSNLIQIFALLDDK